MGDTLVSNSIRVEPGVGLRIIGFVGSRVGSNPTANTKCIGGLLALVNGLKCSSGNMSP